MSTVTLTGVLATQKTKNYDFYIYLSFGIITIVLFIFLIIMLVKQKQSPSYSSPTPSHNNNFGTRSIPLQPLKHVRFDLSKNTVRILNDYADM